MADTPAQPTAKVRLSHRPDEERDIPLDEVPVLRHQGLLLSVDGAWEPGREPEASDQPAAKATAPAAKKEAAA